MVESSIDEIGDFEPIETGGFFKVQAVGRRSSV